MLVLLGLSLGHGLVAARAGTGEAAAATVLNSTQLGQPHPHVEGPLTMHQSMVAPPMLRRPPSAAAGSGGGHDKEAGQTANHIWKAAANLGSVLGN